ncbi:MAG TPA: signal peptidase I [Gemmatimonadaceae bacterium]|nr:signal peptidase I [Gemmatimonadaceae bacterium]
MSEQDLPQSGPGPDASVSAASEAASPAVADPAAAVPPRRRRFRPLRALWEWAKSLQVAIILFLVVRALLVEAFKIPSGSMEGTLLVGDFLLVNKLVYGAEVPLLDKRLPAVRQPGLGDVVVFQWPEDTQKHFVKRLVGLPGDTLEMRAGTLLRNGVPQEEPYAQRSVAQREPGSDEFRWQRDYLVGAPGGRGFHPTRNDWGPLLVPADHYFVLGDNRDNSLDSRYWGFVPDSLMRGSPMFVYYSYAPDSGKAFDWLTRVRWKRLGDLIH